MPRTRPLAVLLLLAGSAIWTPVAAQSSTLPEVRLYSNVVAWTVAREGRVRAELWSGDTLVGAGQADAASSGTVRVPLFVGGVPGRSAVIRPGHRLLLTGPDGSAQVPAVPCLPPMWMLPGGLPV